MNSLDYLIVGFYAVALIAIATYVSRSKKGQEKTPEEYFLAGSKSTFPIKNAQGNFSGQNGINEETLWQQQRECTQRENAATK